MQPKKLFVSPLLAVTVFTVFAAAAAEESNKDKLSPYKLLTTVAIPGGLNGFDISWVDSEARRYYLADRGNATATPPVPPRIDVIDTKHNKFLFSTPVLPDLTALLQSTERVTTTSSTSRTRVNSG